MRIRIPILVLAGAVAIAGMTYVIFGRADPADEPSDADRDRVVTPERTGAAVATTDEATRLALTAPQQSLERAIPEELDPAPTPVERGSRTIPLPDGTFVPALNGIENPPAPHWERGRPWSPIVGRAHSQGLEWYVHADGTWTTTFRAWRDELGRYDDTTAVYHPGTPREVEDGDE